jgi:hypothetical protein
MGGEAVNPFDPDRYPLVKGTPGMGPRAVLVCHECSPTGVVRRWYSTLPTRDKSLEFAERHWDTYHRHTPGAGG